MRDCPNCGHEIDAQARFCPSCGMKLAAAGLDTSLLGRTLNDKYRVVEELGTGSMGKVYLAEHIGLGKKVALKVLHPELQVSEENLQRFQREGVAAGKFNHPNAIQVFDFDRWEKLFFLAMEFVEGQSLREFLQDRKRLTLAESIPIVRQVLRAQAEAHGHGIVHRDLKPENIMVVLGLTGELSVKVLDFGLSKLVDLPKNSTLATLPGRIMGTPLYMAPEQAAGGEVDPRADLYAVGLIWYELLTGEGPFHAESIVELIAQKMSDASPRLTDSLVELGLPLDLVEILRRAIAKDPDDRFASATEMLKALESVDPNAVLVRSRRAAGGGERRTPLLKLAGAVIGVAALIGIGWKLTRADAALTVTPRVSMKSADRRTELEARYVRLLEEARGLLLRGDTSAALSKVQDAQQLECRDSEAFLVRARVYQARGDVDTALADLLEALRVDPEYAAAAAAVGWIELERRRLDEARGRFDAAARGAPSAEALAGQGAVHYLLGDCEAARPLLQRAKSLDPECAPARYYLGRIALDDGDPTAAQEELVQAKRSDAASWEVRAALGEAYLLQGRPQDAEAQFTDALELEPEAAWPATSLAALMVEGERFAEAGPVVARALRHNPGVARLHVLDATRLEGRGEIPAAIEALEAAVAIDDEDADVRTLLGILRAREGQHEAAAREFRAALQLDPDLALARLDLGLVLVALERYEEAESELAQSLALDPDNAFARLSLGVLYKDFLEDATKAREQLEAYKALGGDDSRVDGWLRQLGG